MRHRVINKLLPSASPLHDPDVSRGMVIAVVVGVVAGFGAVIFRNLIGMFHEAAFEGGKSALSGMGEYYVILVPAAGGLIVGPLIYFFAREAKGHGVPEVMIAVAKHGGRIRARVALVKILASAITIGSGGSVGREGPIVQIEATFGSVIAQRLGLPKEWMRTPVACGAAGGISATFNAPIAGVFFALEVILGSFTTRYFAVVVVSSVVAAVVSHAFFPDIANLNVPQYGLESAKLLLVVTYRRLDEALRNFQKLCRERNLPYNMAGIIVTQDGELTEAQINHCQKFRIPVAATPFDTYDAVIRMGHLVAKLDTLNKKKIERAIALFEEHVDVSRIIAL